MSNRSDKAMAKAHSYVTQTESAISARLAKLARQQQAKTLGNVGIVTSMKANLFPKKAALLQKKADQEQVITNELKKAAEKAKLNDFVKKLGQAKLNQKESAKAKPKKEYRFPIPK
jgi:hypothetical protein